jgi:hypothetical protein
MTRFFHLDSKTILITAITLLLLYFLVVGQDNNWVKHEDPLGFSIKHPPGWKVNVSEGRIEVFSPDRGTGAIIKPFIQEPAMKASDYVSNFASGLGGKIYPGSEKQRSNVPGLDEILAVIKTNHQWRKISLHHKRMQE